MEYQYRRKETQQERYSEISGRNGENAVTSEVNLGLSENKRGPKKFFDNRIAYEFQNSAEEVKWFTTAEAAQYLRVSISSIKTMICRGQIRVHKLGRRNRFLKDELERLITIPVFNRR